MHKFPKWLPSDVQAHAERLILKGGLGSLEPTLLRLVTNPEMEPIWKKLSSLNNDPQKLIDFLEHVRLHSVLFGTNTEPIAIPSDRVQRQAYDQVKSLTKHIISELRNLSASNDPQAGWAQLERSLRRTELHLADKTSQGESYIESLQEIKAIQTRLDAVQAYESIISLLKLIESAAQYAASAPDEPLPKKRNSENAKRNQLVLDISQYLQYHFDIDSPVLIAAIVNTAFEPFEDGGVNADDVRKLISAKSGR